MSRTTTLFHVSDLHFGYEDRAALDWFASEVARDRPDWIVCTGDVTMRGTAREFVAAARWLGNLAAPVSLEIGNHDVPYYWYPLARVFRPYRLYRELDGVLSRRVDLPDVAAVSLSTVAAFQWRLNLSKGRVAAAALDQALGELSHVQHKPLRLVTCHHPLLDADTHSRGSTRGGGRALAALTRAGAQAVLSGHVHDPFDRTVDCQGQPIRLIGAGTLSPRLRATQPSYNRLDWSPGTGLHVQVRAAE
ncbi:MAG: hypothetical protein RLZZ136_965 [Pseudomonadota bacterium]